MLCIAKAKQCEDPHKQCIMWIRKSQGSKDEGWHGIEKIRLGLLQRREETICDGEELHKLCIVRQYGAMAMQRLEKSGR